MLFAEIVTFGPLTVFMRLSPIVLLIILTAFLAEGICANHGSTFLELRVEKTQMSANHHGRGEALLQPMFCANASEEESRTEEDNHWAQLTPSTPTSRGVLILNTLATLAGVAQQTGGVPLFKLHHCWKSDLLL